MRLYGSRNCWRRERRKGKGSTRDLEVQVILSEELVQAKFTGTITICGSHSFCFLLVGTCDETESVTESDRTSLESQSLKEQQQQLEEQKISVLQNKELLSAVSEQQC